MNFDFILPYHGVVCNTCIIIDSVIAVQYYNNIFQVQNGKDVTSHKLVIHQIDKNVYAIKVCAFKKLVWLDNISTNLNLAKSSTSSICAIANLNRWNHIVFTHDP